FTSGSTSRPKGVTLTHENLAANVKCIMHDGLQSGPDDVGVSWLPLFHDMGLIGFVLAPLVYQVSSVFVPSLLFLKRPVSWFQAMTKYRGSIAYAPNFAYALAVKRIRERELENIDLSTWRVAGCGAEPIRAETLHTFADTFAKVGFRREALLPSYGMAESSLAVAFTELHEGVKVLHVDGDRLWSAGVAEVVASESEGSVPVVSCGKGFPDHRLAIYAQDDAESAAPLLQGHVGEIRIQGPSVMRGYWEDVEKTQATFAGSMLRTGDLGFLHEDRLYVCGRSKEVVIVNGRNYYPQDLEWEASKVPGVRKGNVIAFGARTGVGDRERVVVAFELQLEGTPSEAVVAERGAALAQQVRKAVQEGMALTLDDAVALPPGALPKTSSGKLQRALSRQLYEAGELGDRRSAREADKLGLLVEAAKSQFSFLKRAVLGKTPPKA
ncbi:MAG: fatty acyl-AMP ligase, partial [Proteobacteria bacterium]